MQQLTDFAGEQGMSAAPLRNLMKSVLLVPQGALKKNLAAELIREDLVTLGLSEDKASHFSQQWTEHQEALSRQAVSQALMVNQLLDMEWKFGDQDVSISLHRRHLVVRSFMFSVTVGTSETQKVGNIYLQLKLVVRKGNSTENVFMELTLPQFYNFLHEMERAKASMECFS
ncbi:COMM domain-containing protein 7 isoform X2 [Pleuronectes platessa]|uniref:COMM domain-containing protein 7 isoform X2 n=1 Tax=Pleuronectes platessa TaxID=8262 RepID=UPI00232A278F|nr:COMM domain-containing protein 7 isoform X2 [Pleuronectes platessa]